MEASEDGKDRELDENEEPATRRLVPAELFKTHAVGYCWSYMKKALYNGAYYIQCNACEKQLRGTHARGAEVF